MKNKFLLFLCFLIFSSPLQPVVPLIAATVVIGENITAGTIIKLVAIAGIFGFCLHKVKSSDSDGGSSQTNGVDADKKLSRREVWERMNAFEIERLNGHGSKRPDDEDDDKPTWLLTKFANILGFNKMNKRSPNGEAFYKKGQLEITHDNTTHNGGFWKLFNRGERVGTYNIFLKTRLKD